MTNFSLISTLTVVLAFLVTCLTGCAPLQARTSSDMCVARGAGYGVLAAGVGHVGGLPSAVANVIGLATTFATIERCEAAIFQAQGQVQQVQQVARGPLDGKVVDRQSCVALGGVPKVHPNGFKECDMGRRVPTNIGALPQVQVHSPQVRLCLYQIGWTNQANPGLGNGGHANDSNVGTWNPGNAVPRGHKVKPC